MPSTQTHGAGKSYEPSKHADDWATDPAKILAKDEQTLKAIIRGLQDPDYIQAVIEVEIDRESRGEIIGLLNERQQQVRECPRGCESPVMERFKTGEEFQIKHQNATWHKTCVTLTDDGEAIVVLHDEPEPEPEPESRPVDAGKDTEPVDEEDATDDADDDEPDGEPESDTAKRLLDHIDSERSDTLAGIKGWAQNELNLSPDQTKHHLKSLENGGYIEETSDGVYATS